MEQNCKNCNEISTGNFCSNCGQKRYKRIDRKYIFDEVQYTFLHTNKGLLYSAKNILKNPGKTAREFIDGKRVNHYKPILLTFLLAGISAFLSFKVLKSQKIMSAALGKQYANNGFMDDLISIMSNYMPIIMVLFIPLIALTTKIAFRRWGQNYFEHIVMNAYILSFYTLITIIFVTTIMFIFRHNPSTSMSVSLWSMLLIPVILVWFFKGFYIERRLKTIIVRVLAIVGLLLLGYILLIILVTIGAVIHATLKGPETLKYFKPH